MKYRIAQTSRFKKDLKAIRKRGYDLSLMEEIPWQQGNRCRQSIGTIS